MSNYVCEDCNYNNNGWCKKKSFNGLKKKNIQKCDEYKINIVDVDKRDLTLQKMISTAGEKYEILQTDVINKNCTHDELINSSMSLLNLQKGIIENLLIKIKILEGK